MPTNLGGPKANAAITIDSDVGVIGLAGLIVYLLAIAFILFGCLVQLWPSAITAADPATAPTTLHLFSWSFSVSSEVRLLLLVAITGALGSIVHALRSLYWYFGNRSLVYRWLPMYIMLPFTGTTLALLFYLVVRGGFFAPSATVQQANPYGFTALASLIGMFSPQAVLKLKQVAETVLTKPEPGADAVPQEAKGT